MRRLLLAVVLLLAAAPAARAESVTTLAGYRAPGTPARLDKVTVVKEGPASARNVLVLAPGTQAGAGYLLPVARDIVARLPGWQVWSVDRRENLLEDHTALDDGSSPQQIFDYYLGWIGNAGAGRHLSPVADAPWARDWGMKVAVEDLRRVIAQARKGGRTVVLGGHSLGATIAVAYASWDFGGRAGARDLAGLVLIDGGAGGTLSSGDARKQLGALRTGSPFLDIVGLGLPWATGVLAAVGSTLALRAPDEPAVLGSWPLLPSALKPPVPVTNKAAFGFAIDASTGPANLALVQAHIGHVGPGGGWVDAGPGTEERAAAALSGIKGIDGTAWYFPRRLSLDAGAVDGGVANPAQKVLGVRATHGKDLRLPIYALQTSLGKGRVLKAAKALARRSHAPELELVDRSATYSHCDPLFASPKSNDFLKTVVPFLRRASAAAAREPAGD